MGTAVGHSFVPPILYRELKAAITTCNLASSDDEPSQDACDAFLWRGQVVALLADGVGSSAHGGEAANRVVESIGRDARSRPALWPIDNALGEFCQLVNRVLHRESIAMYGTEELLTTVVGIVVEGRRLKGINVGDSRLYLLREGTLMQLSEDHVDSLDPASHVITRAVGMSPQVDIYEFSAAVANGDVLLLCSDGVYNQFEPEEIVDQLSRRLTARDLVDEARTRADEETIDDMSAVVIELEELPVVMDPQVEFSVPGELKAAQIVDGFKLIRSLNQDERTWLTEKDGKRLAIKFPPLEAAHSDMVRHHFLNEIWSAVRLDEGFFVKAYVPEGVSTLCYCMEYFECPTLKECIESGGSFRIDEALALARFLIEACRFLVSLGLVHGDLRPEKVLVLKAGSEMRFKLFDFISFREIYSVSSGSGSYSYIAPERFHGVPMSEYTEVFALGVTVYEALTGHLPYGAIEPLQNPRFEPAKRPSHYVPRLPEWLDFVLLRAIAIDPDDRFKTYSELKQAIDDPVEGNSLETAGNNNADNSSFWSVKKSLLAISLIIVVIFFVLLVTGD